MKGAEPGIRAEFGYDVAFCVWVLLADGMHVSPFECHPDGDGSLRAAGLTAEAWQAWVQRVVASAEAEWRWVAAGLEIGDVHLYRLATRVIALRARLGPLAVVVGFWMLLALLWRGFRMGRERRATHPSADPVTEWEGSDAIGVRLAELWKRYLRRPPFAKMGGEEMRSFLASEECRLMLWQLWKGSGPERYVFLVDYPQPVRYRVGESTTLLSLTALPLNVADAREVITGALDSLAAS